MCLQPQRRQVRKILHDCFKPELRRTWVSGTSEGHTETLMDTNRGNPKEAHTGTGWERKQKQKNKEGKKIHTANHNT